MAAHLETTDFWGRQLSVLHGLKQSKLPKPIRIPRPGDERKTKSERKVTTDPAAIAAMFGIPMKRG